MPAKTFVCWIKASKETAFIRDSNDILRSILWNNYFYYNSILKDRKQAAADGEKYTHEKLAEANKLLFDNEGYVRLEIAKSLSTNTKFFFSGDQSPLSSILAQIMGEDKNQTDFLWVTLN